MENELAPEESVSFINGTIRQNLPRSRETKHWKWRRECLIFLAVGCIAVALLVLTFTAKWHSDTTLQNSIASASFKLCGNQSAKACIQDPECSSSRVRRLVNGKIARNDTWPWMAEIVYNRKHYCGAALISNDILITAAHCLFHHENRLYEEDIEIRIGSRKRLSVDESTQILTVSNIYIHHSFHLSSLQNDIAILRLSSPVQLSRSVWPICLAAGPQSGTGSSEGIMIGPFELLEASIYCNDLRPLQNVAKLGHSPYLLLRHAPDCRIFVLLGWGKTSKNGHFSSLLRETSVPIVPISKCIIANRGLFDGVKVTEHNQICVGYGKDRPDYGCNGDSGGPLMVQSNNNRWMLLGIMSWGEPQCSAERTNSYTVFTSISPHMNWIEKFL